MNKRLNEPILPPELLPLRFQRFFIMRLWKPMGCGQFAPQEDGWQDLLTYRPLNIDLRYIYMVIED